MTTSLTRPVTRRIVSALAGTALAAAALAGGLAPGIPHARADSGSPTTCTTARVVGPPPTMLNPLTRPAQVSSYYAPLVPVPAAISCVGH